MNTPENAVVTHTTTYEHAGPEGGGASRQQHSSRCGASVNCGGYR